MIDELKEVELSQSLAAAVHLDIPREEIAPHIDRAIREVLECLSANEIEPSGPLFAHHRSVSDSRFDIEVGFPIANDVCTSGRVGTITLPAMKAVSTTYKGPYEGLYQAWSEFGAAARSGGYQLKGTEQGEASFREIYRIGPEAGADSTRWETDLFLPISSLPL